MNLDLRLRPLYGRDRMHIPGLSDVVREASGQFFIVHVKGTPANPTFKLEALPQLSDGVRDTFRSWATAAAPAPRQMAARAGGVALFGYVKK